MAEIYCANFKFGNVESDTYNLIFANIDTSRFIQLYGEFDSSYVFNKKSKKKYIASNNYTESPVSIDIDIVTADGSAISESSIRLVEKWLFGLSSYRKLYIHDPSMDETVDGETKKLYLNCRFINPERQEYNGGIVGFKCTMECDSNMFWQDPITQTISGGGGTHTYTVTVDSDMYDEYIYPTVSVRMTGSSSAGGVIDITNLTDDEERVTRFEGVPAGDLVKIYNDINYTSHYQNFTKKNFIRLLNGSNSIKITGGLDIQSIEITYQNRRLF